MRNIDKNTISNFKKGYELEYNSILLFVIMMSSNFLNYLFQILMGNLLSVEDYGTLTALLSMISIVSVISTIFTMVTAKYTVQLASNSQYENIRRLFTKMSWLIAIFAVVVIISSTVFSAGISDIFKINDSRLIIFTFFVIAISTFYSIALGVLQGMKRFFHYGITGLIATLGKLLFSIALVLLGYQLFGVITAILLGIIVATLYGLYHVRDVFKTKQAANVTAFKLNGFGRYLSKVLLAQIFISIIANSDILLVKYFFTSEEAGYYSSAMVLGKISMYVASAIVAAMFPIAAERMENGSSIKRLLSKSLIYGGGIAIACAVVLNLFSEFVIKIMYGAQYITAAQYMLPISVLIIPVTFFMILMNYQLAVSNSKPLVLSLALSIVFSGFAVVLFHSSIPQLLYGISGCLASGVILDLMIAKIQQNRLESH